MGGHCRGRAAAGRHRRPLLEQIGLSLRPASVVVANAGLRLFCHYLIDAHPHVDGFAAVGRAEIEGFKRSVAQRRTAAGKPLSTNTVRGRLGMLCTFFDRIIEWDWDDAPARTPIYTNDLPRPDEPLPKFLDDGDAVSLARSVAAEPDPRRRLVLELLSRTGIRVGELCALEADAVVRIGEGWWLRVPPRQAPQRPLRALHPQLLPLLEAWSATHDDNGTGLLLINRRRAINRQAVVRMLKRAGRRAGLGHLHPHQLRHILATQAVNRGMRLEAIAALLGHRTLRMTIRYARIANKTVADECHAVSEKVEALCAAAPALDAEVEGPTMRRVRARAPPHAGRRPVIPLRAHPFRPVGLEPLLESFSAVLPCRGSIRAAVEGVATVWRRRNRLTFVVALLLGATVAVAPPASAVILIVPAPNLPDTMVGQTFSASLSITNGSTLPESAIFPVLGFEDIDLYPACGDATPTTDCTGAAEAGVYALSPTGTGAESESCTGTWTIVPDTGDSTTATRYRFVPPGGDLLFAPGPHPGAEQPAPWRNGDAQRLEELHAH